MQNLKNTVAGSVMLLSTSLALAGWSLNPALSGVGNMVNLHAQSQTAKKPRKVSTTKPTKLGNASFYSGSEESVSERDRRLKRECKGRSNSGLCEGYTR